MSDTLEEAMGSSNTAISSSQSQHSCTRYELQTRDKQKQQRGAEPEAAPPLTAFFCTLLREQRT